MSNNHFGGNIQPGLDLEEHRGDANSKRVTLVGSTGTVIGTETHGDNTHLLTDTLDQTVTGTLGELNATVEMEVHGIGSVIVNVSGTWTGKILFEGAVNGTWANLSMVQPLGGITQNGIQNDNQNGNYRVLIVAGYSKVRARMALYTNGTATILINGTDLVATNYVWQLNPLNLRGTYLIADPTTSLLASVETRKQTPTGNALNVQIGPGDVISNIPVMIDFDHHQVHEGETHHVNSLATTIGTDTHKFGISLPTYTTTIQAPHMLIGADIYNGAVRLDLYAEATLSGGATMASYNRNRNSTTKPGTAILSGVTAVDGNLINTMFMGAGTREAGGQRSLLEWVLKSGAKYRVDVVGLTAGTQYIADFDWYEDLGV